MYPLWHVMSLELADGAAFLADGAVGASEHAAIANMASAALVSKKSFFTGILRGNRPTLGDLASCVGSTDQCCAIRHSRRRKAVIASQAQTVLTGSSRG
jgi:hypothetical protein